MNDVPLAEPEVRHGPLAEVAEVLRQRDLGRVFVITTPSRRHLPALLEALDGLEVEVFDQARVHVPADTVAAAKEAAAAFAPDAIVTLGGGAATGLGKALRLELDACLVVIPTTFSASEATRIWGITDGATKRTGRDLRVRPNVVQYDASLVVDLPRATAMASLLNAAAHPIGALSANDDAAVREASQRALAELTRAAWEIAGRTSASDAFDRAFAATYAAGRVLDTAELGAQHRVAHVLGGRLSLPHAPLHAALLGPFVHQLDPPPRSAVAEAMTTPDPSGLVHDLLRRVGASTSLRALGPTWAEVRAALDDAGLSATADWVMAAYLGRRMSTRSHYSSLVPGAPPASRSGPPPGAGRRTILTVPSSGETADDALARVRQIIGEDPAVTIVAPQPDPVAAPPVGDTLDALVGALGGTDDHPLSVFGVGEAAESLLHWASGTDVAIDTMFVVDIGRAPTAWPSVGAGLRGSQVTLSWPEARPPVGIDAIAMRLTDAGAQVDSLIVPGGAGGLGLRQRAAARAILLDRPDPPGGRGFGNVHEVESLPDALPRRQNSPRRCAYGLYAEQINGTGFVAPRATNRRSWLYRIRPSANRPPFCPLSLDAFSSDFVGEAPEIDLVAHAPLSAPAGEVDFIEGLHTWGGAGDPSQRRGWALHLYAATKSMEDRAFYDADGELLILPERGNLTLATELGLLTVHPGELAIIPRGMLFSVALHDGFARGYVAEVFGRQFELPERGPVGANSLTDPRHFRTPSPWYEDRLAPGYSIVGKLGGRTYETRQDYSPFDVVAWHGNLTPYAYDLMDFLPVSTVRRDHVDPSVYTVVSAPMDEPGSHCLDLVVFPPRWDPTENTFRPPFFHRNATLELNGIIREARGDEMFHAGMCFATPPMTPHGVRADAVERTLAESHESADEPRRMWADALWFQFESALPLALTRWARTSPGRLADWPDRWGQYRAHFDPNRLDPFADS